MADLFERLINEQNYWDAQIVGKNLFCRNSNDFSVFSRYFDFCIMVANFPVEFETRAFFLNEAELSLTIFSEKAEVTTDVLNVITDKRKILTETAHEISVAQEEHSKFEVKVFEENNDKILQNLAKLEGKLKLVTKQEELDAVLEDMSAYEKALSKDSFTPEQNQEYTLLTKDFSALVSEAMETISVELDKEYNKRAVSSFKKAFDLFKADEDKFKKHDSALYELVSSYLFAFDAKRLYSESLVYYNHIYTYIFNKLDDEGKFRFTQFSFDVPKNQ